jgi:potassium-transporting ATPase KdpC subunit
MKNQTIIALKFLLIMTVLTGIIYPLVMTGFAQVCFPLKANGSLIAKDGKIIGSGLIGQKFDSCIYFWPRPSAVGYNPIPSGASNYGPTSDTLRKLVASRRDLFAKTNSLDNKFSIPKEMIFASASGLDPHISPNAALLQVERIAKARNLSSVQKDKLNKLVNSLIEPHQLLILGEDRVNVLKLNLEMDRIFNDTNYNK